MKFIEVIVRNLMGARRVNLRLDTPITLVAGFNGSGKSSIQEATRMAFSGQTLRVGLKKEYPLMVSDGAKTGSVEVITDAGTASFALPSGSHTLEGALGRGQPDALPFVLDAHSFSRLKAEDRRTFLFNLTGCTVTEQRVREMLVEAKCDAALIEQTLPMLKAIEGFPAAAKLAAEQSTQAKGAWRAITGETYGSKKADGWTAEKPEVDMEHAEAATRQRDNLHAALGNAQTELGALRQRQQEYANRTAQAGRDSALAERLPRLKTKLETDRKNLAEIEKAIEALEQRAGTAPRVGLIHDFARAAEYAIDALVDEERDSVRGVLRQIRTPFDAYVGQFGMPSNAIGDPEANESLRSQRSALTTMQNAVSNAERDIALAEAAAERLKEAGAEPVLQSDVDVARDRIAQLDADYRAATQTVSEIDRLIERARTADENTAKAAKHHELVDAWAKLAEQLSADGIPAQLVAQALRPFNRALIRSATTTDWMQAAIAPDMSLTADGRAYSLLCESEKWRVDAMIAEAIATISGVKVLMLDRVDVLDTPSRIQLLTWLAGRAESGALETVLLFATLKQPPSNLPASITAHWIQEGTIEGAADADTAQAA
jgi:hypothetical protein